MTEEEAKVWLVDTLCVPRETLDLLHRFATLLIEASRTQNLISASTVEHVWERHIVDSAQLLLHAPTPCCQWLDIGSGAGFPGLVVAIIGGYPVTLVEHRALRAAFLRDTVAVLGLRDVDVRLAKVEAVRDLSPGVISARAVAPLGRLFASAAHLADATTLWLLPKGRSAASELAEARQAWQGSFTMHPSVTSAEAAIVVARDVARRDGRRSRA